MSATSFGAFSLTLRDLPALRVFTPVWAEPLTFLLVDRPMASSTSQHLLTEQLPTKADSPAPSLKIRLKLPARSISSAEQSPAAATIPLPPAMVEPPIPQAKGRAPRRSAGAISYAEPPLDEFNDESALAPPPRKRIKTTKTPPVDIGQLGVVAPRANAMPLPSDSSSLDTPHPSTPAPSRSLPSASLTNGHTYGHPEAQPTSLAGESKSLADQLAELEAYANDLVR